MKQPDDLATQRGKRGILTVRIGNLIRTIAVPVERMRNPAEGLRRRAGARRKTKT